MIEHDHSGPDWRCPACVPIADVMRARMQWPSVHWGTLHDDAYASLARAIHDSQALTDLIEDHAARLREQLAKEVLDARMLPVTGEPGSNERAYALAYNKACADMASLIAGRPMVP